jgi:hypothetical protein
MQVVFQFISLIALDLYMFVGVSMFFSETYNSEGRKIRNKYTYFKSMIFITQLLYNDIKLYRICSIYCLW